MGKRDPRVDAYIAKAAPFARPILKELRERVHESFPEIEESIKWGAPAFVHHGIVAMMAAFKSHCAFGYWPSAAGRPEKKEGAMGHYGRLESLRDLPPKREILATVKKIALANASGKKRTVLRHPRQPIPMPDDFRAALAKSAKARRTYEALAPSHQREYLEWVTEARREATRERRLATSIEWLNEGRSRMWRYEALKPASESGKRTPAKPKAAKK